MSELAAAVHAIALLHKRSWLKWGAMGLGVMGMTIGPSAWRHIELSSHHSQEIT